MTWSSRSRGEGGLATPRLALALAAFAVALFAGLASVTPALAHHPTYEAARDCDENWSATATYVGGPFLRRIEVSNVEVNGVAFAPAWSNAPGAGFVLVSPGLYRWEGTSSGFTIFDRSGTGDFVGGASNWGGTITQYYDSNPGLGVTWSVGGTAGGNPASVDVEEPEAEGPCEEGEPNLEIDKSGPGSVGLGGEITYTITVTNTGDAPAQNVVVTDSLSGPGEIIDISVSPGSPTCETSDEFPCSLGDIDPEDDVTITVTVQASQEECGEIDNSASAAADDLTPVTDDSGNEVDVIGCEEGEPNLQIDKSGPGSVGLGGEVTYTITVTNTGDAPSDPFAVHDEVPDGLVWVEADTDEDGFDCAWDDPGVDTPTDDDSFTCVYFGSLEPDESATIVVAFTVPEDALCGEIENVTTLYELLLDTQEPQLGDSLGGDSVTTTVTGCEEEPELGSIKIVKDAVPNDEQDFDFLFDSPTLPDLPLTLDDDPSSGYPTNDLTIISLEPGSYTVTETLVPGWDLTDIDCGEADTSETATGVTINLGAGEHVICTFTNVKEQEPETGRITIRKDTDPETSGVEFHFTGDLGAFDLADDESETDSGLASGTYEVRESSKSGWELTGISCTGGGADTDDDQSGPTAEIHLDGGEHVVCTFNNVREEEEGTPTIATTPLVSEQLTATQQQVVETQQQPVAEVKSLPKSGSGGYLGVATDAGAAFWAAMLAALLGGLGLAIGVRRFRRAR